MCAYEQELKAEFGEHYHEKSWHNVADIALGDDGWVVDISSIAGMRIVSELTQ